MQARQIGFLGWVKGMLQGDTPERAAARIPAPAWQRAVAGLVLAGVAIGAHAATFDEVHASAMAGDYQAQRNLAYGYGSAPYKGQDKNPLLACAWRIVILQSGNERVNPTDTSNHQVYCGALAKPEQAAAAAQARQLYQRVYKREARF